MLATLCVVCVHLQHSHGETAVHTEELLVLLVFLLLKTEEQTTSRVLNLEYISMVGNRGLTLATDFSLVISQQPISFLQVEVIMVKRSIQVQFLQQMRKGGHGELHVQSPTSFGK